MKIFFVSRGWPSVRNPLWGCFERDQALALSKLGHRIVVLSVDARFRKYHRKYGITKEIHGDITHYNLFAGSIWGKVLRTVSVNLHIKIKKQMFLFLFKNVIKEEGLPDLIYAHYLGNLSMALAAKQKYGIPIVGMEHWSELGYQNINKNIKYWAGKVYKDLDLLLTVSSALQKNILKNFGKNSVVVNNMISQEFHYEPHVNKKDKVMFVTVGSLFPVKGFDNLIAAFSQLQLPIQAWTLTIVGGGKEYGKLKKQVERNHFEKNIFLVGKKNREDVLEILHDSDVYVMSSRMETFGVAAVEALACGLPAIATECGGSADFMNSTNGVTCPVDNVEKLAECIVHMFSHYKDYNRKKIAEDCQNRFSSDTIAKRLTDIFEKVVEKTDYK